MWDLEVTYLLLPINYLLSVGKLLCTKLTRPGEYASKKHYFNVVHTDGENGGEGGGGGESGDGGDSLVLVWEEKEEVESVELHFFYSYFWKYY